MPDVGPALQLDDDDLTREAQITDADVTRARSWAQQRIPAPWNRIPEADVIEREQDLDTDGS